MKNTKFFVCVCVCVCVYVCIVDTAFCTLYNSDPRSPIMLEL